jgi:hypothetical protein
MNFFLYAQDLKLCNWAALLKKLAKYVRLPLAHTPNVENKTIIVRCCFKHYLKNTIVKIKSWLFCDIKNLHNFVGLIFVI